MFNLFRSPSERAAADRAYLRVVEQARRPGFFAGLGVPDTLDGRFDLICLHAFLYLHRLKRERPRAARLAQSFFDAMFVDFDRSLRELGTGDLSVGRQVKRMAEAFYGRVQAYEEGLAGADPLLKQALSRNLFRREEGPEPVLSALALYVRREAARLAAQDTAELLAGRVVFDEPPSAVGATLLKVPP
ncbi:MAG TPA: ubiquinol-cytochrome C chaperone family protein [Stellaceae bacterium]|nr:ubiquinol-cytochrome C chaperone family protein [Stellaceae bacterium]